MHSKAGALRKRNRLGLWLLVAAVSAGCASHAGSGDSDSNTLHERLQGLATRYGVCDVAAAVIRDRKVQSIEVAQGCASQSPLTPDSVFEAASLSKPVFAYAVLQLVREGRMDLDAPVVKYLPEGYQHRFQPYRRDSQTDRVSDQRLQAVTVRMALNHTSGLPNWSNGPLEFDFTPGDKWQYSGEGYVLLQRAVEAVTHQDLDEFMARRVFEPLGMTHSAYTLKPQLQEHAVPPKTGDGTPLKLRPLHVPVSAFSLYTTAQDYGVFLATLLNDERSVTQIVASPVPVDPRLNLSWGLGWGVEREGGDLSIWQWGNNPGYRAFVMASTQTGDGFVMLTNSDGGLAMAEPLSKVILGGEHPVFRFRRIRGGLAGFVCETIGLCF